MGHVKELPHDLLAEKSLLGCLIIDGNSFDEIADLSLQADDFFHPQYASIYDSISDLIGGNQPVDYVTVCSKLAERGRLEEIGGKSNVLEIAEDQASSANVYYYGKIVKDKSILRNIVKTAMRVADKGMDYKGSVDDYVSEVEASFFRLTSETKNRGMVPLNSCLKNNLKELEDTSRSLGEISGLSTGYPKLDELLLGMQPGQLIVIASRPAMGKTSLGLNMGINACQQTGLPVAIFSLEMLANELSMRILSSKSKVDSKRIKRKDFQPMDLRSIGTAIQELSTLPVFINDFASISILDIQSYSRKIKSEQGLGMVIVDYLQLMRSHTNNPSREQQISEISRGLKNMAKELECPVIALSQLNRQVESRPNKRPNVSDLRESGSIEQDADIVMMIYRDEVYNLETKEKGVAEIIVGKNRSGETGTAKLAWVGQYTSFENLAYEHYREQ